VHALMIACRLVWAWSPCPWGTACAGARVLALEHGSTQHGSSAAAPARTPSGWRPCWAATAPTPPGPRTPGPGPGSAGTAVRGARQAAQASGERRRASPGPASAAHRAAASAQQRRLSRGSRAVPLQVRGASGAAHVVRQPAHGRLAGALSLAAARPRAAAGAGRLACAQEGRGRGVWPGPGRWPSKRQLRARVLQRWDPAPRLICWAAPCFPCRRWATTRKATP
jgi:hypothetical protein